MQDLNDSKVFQTLIARPIARLSNAVWGQEAGQKLEKINYGISLVTEICTEIPASLLIFALMPIKLMKTKDQDAFEMAIYSNRLAAGLLNSAYWVEDQVYDASSAVLKSVLKQLPSTRSTLSTLSA